MMGSVHVSILAALVAFTLTVVEPSAQAATPQHLIQTLCSDCHSPDAAEGDVVLRPDEIDWSDPGALAVWENVHDLVKRGIMPPPDAEQPTDGQRSQLLDWLDRSLVEHQPIGGTPIRRLSGREYANTIRDVFMIPSFELPLSFPPDHLAEGFDNLASSLVIAPSHLDAFSETATLVADELFPPPRASTPSRTVVVPPNDLVISYSSACLIDGAMRLASSGTNLRRNATWPTKFEAPRRGRYHIEVTASVYGEPTDEPLRLRVLAIDGVNVKGDEDRYEDCSIQPGDRQTFEWDMQLDVNETIAMRNLNGSFQYEDKTEFADYLKSFLGQNPKLAAAWASIGNPARGGSGWQRVKEAMAGEGLDSSIYKPGSDAVDKLAQQLAKKSVDTGETLVYKFFEEGPGIAVHQVKITGPVEVFPDEADARRDRQQKRFWQTYLPGGGDTDLVADSGRGITPHLNALFGSLLRSAYRRPPTDDEIDAMVSLVDRELRNNGDRLTDKTSIDQIGFQRAMHLAIRTISISPSFLFRNTGLHDETESATLSSTELASRLSYFLTSRPPDEQLRRWADTGQLLNSFRLRKEASRLAGEPFARDFTRQWLHLHTLDNLMPDPALLRKFTLGHRTGMTEEITQSFSHVLKNNLPVSDLINPDFMFTNNAVATDIYEISNAKTLINNAPKSGKSGVVRLPIEPGGRLGGLLSMSGVMMATANGVDTQPVLRGVWMLENIMGSPPPDPPDAVPALTPDTTGASSPKERLAAHMSSNQCAVCHREIDPLGFVLENYDAIGRWRDRYPSGNRNSNKKNKAAQGTPIDTTGTMPSGVELSDVTDLKRWLAANPESFAQCLSEKLMTYATGRELNYHERRLIADIIQSQQENELRLDDLLQALVDSPVFRNR
ncbi:MAG: DUF1588 domain-containing protein [Rubripirellula sp.]